jgi:hypothetical protein
MEPGDHIEDRYPGAVCRPIRRAGQAHQAGERLHHEVVAGDVRRLGGGAKSTDRCVHDPWVSRTHGVVAELEATHRPRLEVLDQDVGTMAKGHGEGAIPIVT